VREIYWNREGKSGLLYRADTDEFGGGTFSTLANNCARLLRNSRGREEGTREERQGNREERMRVWEQFQNERSE
jgi:hypothetical protein